jgi:hypothetical protein
MSHFNIRLEDMVDSSSIFESLLKDMPNYTPTGEKKALRTSDSTLGPNEGKKSLTTFNVSDILQGSVVYKPQGLVYNSFNEAMSKSLSSARGAVLNGKNILAPGVQTGLVGYDTNPMTRIDIGSGASALLGSTSSTGTSSDPVTSSGGGGAGSGPGPEVFVPPTGKSWPKGKLTVDDVAKLVIEVGISEDAQAAMVAIARRESSFNSMSSNQVPPDNSWGLWQINTIDGASPQYRPYDLTDPYTNAIVMARMSGSGGNLHPWVTQKDGSNEPGYSSAYDVRDFMPEALAAVQRVKSQGYRAG